ncbi:MAG: hypothetical protein BV456_12725, partial [Thermoplasmata archaeon M8B2D]
MLCLLVLSGLESGAISIIYNETETNYSYTLELSPQIQYEKTDTINGKYTTLTIDEEGYTTKIGEAQLPVFYRMVQIPYGSDPRVSVVSASWEETTLQNLGLPEMVMPLQPSVFKNQEPIDDKFVINTQYYTTNAFFQTTPVEIKETGIIRGHRFALVQISPVQYNPVTGQLKTVTNIEVEITVDNADMKNTNKNIQRYTTQAFEKTLQQTLINYNDFNTQPSSTLVSNLILIIVYDEYADDITPLKNWKESIGYTVVVTKTSEIPGGATTTNIRNYIETAYNDWPVPPGFILLVGDTGQIPAFTGDASNTATDLYYAAVDGTDYFADIYIGRFPANQPSHVTAMVDKTIAYESGDWANTDFLEKGAFMAGNDNYQVSEGTHNYVISSYFEPHGMVCDKLYEVTYGATTNDVSMALNDGRVIAIYSGHGSTTSWADGPQFSQSDVMGLTNINMLSFVCSHACVTGSYNIGECFGETWIRAPNKGAIIFWGSSANTLWDEDDILEKKTLADYYNYESVGGMTETGKLGLYSYYGGGGYTKYYFECYNIFGDPSIIIGLSWTGGGGGGGGGDEPNWIPPRVGINTPRKNDEINGTVTISGYSYGIEGPIKYVLIKIGDSNYLKPKGLEDWSYIWDTTTIPDGEVLLQAVSIDSHGHQSGFDYVNVIVKNIIPDIPKIPDLTSNGSLNWTEVKAGTMVNGTFNISNVGDNESTLNWEVTEYPLDWGRWTINPTTGESLTPEQGIINIKVTVEAPNVSEQNFTGQIKIVNTENSSD